MNQYHKIQSVFKRDPDTKYKTLLEGEFSLPEFEYLKDNEWIFTEKIDGTNIRVMFTGDEILFGGKTEKAQLPPNLTNNLMKEFFPKLDLFKDTFDSDMIKEIGVCFYGEGYGGKIQKGGKYKKEEGFVLFDIKIGKFWLQRKDLEKIAINFDIEIVPIIGSGTLLDMIEMMRKGFTSKWGMFAAEGIVARPAIEFKARNGERIITKIKYKDFLR